jgi:hypothetical protein
MRRRGDSGGDCHCCWIHPIIWEWEYKVNSQNVAHINLLTDVQHRNATAGPILFFQYECLTIELKSCNKWPQYSAIYIPCSWVHKVKYTVVSRHCPAYKCHNSGGQTLAFCSKGWAQSWATSFEIPGGWSGTGAGIYLSFFSFPLC